MNLKPILGAVALGALRTAPMLPVELVMLHSRKLSLI